jgi:peptide/nickel transport system ATP-binding protein
VIDSRSQANSTLLLDVEPRPPLLQVDRLTTRFPTSRGVLHAVDAVSLTLAQGEALGIVGESGSGKSVLSRSIMRLLPDSAVTSGTVRFGDLDLNAMPAAAVRSLWGDQIAMVFQNPMTSLNPVMRVGRQVREVLERHRDMDRRAAQARVVELFHMVGIPEPERRLRSYPHEMSGGMRQRVCIAIAIACAPRLLLADEPTTALDVTMQRQILDVMDRLRADSNMAMILVTHDLGVVAGRTDRVLVMYGGRVVESGNTVTLFEDPRHPYTAALLSAIPRLENPPHSHLVAIPGRPVDVLDPAPGCRFAPRCARAQRACVAEDPRLLPVAGGHHEHAVACFFPVGSPEGEDALRRNLESGVSAAGLVVDTTTAEAG